MPDIDKLMNVAIGDIDKVINVSTDDIEKIMGADVPAAAGAAWLGARAVIGGGWAGSAPSSAIDYWTIAADVTALDGGVLTNASQGKGGASNQTVGLWAGGYDSTAYSNTVDKIANIASVSGAAAFGTLSESVNGIQFVTNGTLAMRMGGRTSGSGTDGTAVCEVFTIGDTSGNSAVAHGTLTYFPRRIGASISGSTRAIIAGGRTSVSSEVIQYKVFASSADSVDFGNLHEAMETAVGAEDATRGVTMGGYDTSPARSNKVQYFTIDGADGFTATDAMNLYNDVGDNQGAGVSDGTYCELAAGTSDHDGIQRMTIQALSGTASHVGTLHNAGRYLAGGFSGNS